jgi:hypothetical protein
MPMNSVTVRFPADVRSAIRIEAEKQGVSEAAIIRVGALSYVAFCVARRGDKVTEAFDALWDAARELLEIYPL